jgi:hypothetical protein
MLFKLIGKYFVVGQDLLICFILFGLNNSVWTKFLMQGLYWATFRLGLGLGLGLGFNP